MSYQVYTCSSVKEAQSIAILAATNNGADLAPDDLLLVIHYSINGHKLTDNGEKAWNRLLDTYCAES